MVEIKALSQYSSTREVDRTFQEIFSSRTRQPPRALSTFLISTLLIFYTFESSYLADAFLPGLTRTCFLLTLVYSAAGIVVCFFQGRIFTSLAGVAMASFLAWQHWVFSTITQTPPNFNALAAFSPLLVFTALIAFARSPKQVLRLFLIISIIYLAFYVFLHPILLRMALRSGVHAALGADSTRTERLYLIAPICGFVLFSGSRDHTLNRYARGLCIILSGLALYLSGSRAILFIFAVTLGFSFFRKGPRVAAYLYAILFTSLSCLILYGLIDTDWNPFTTYSIDSSAAARSDEYGRALILIYKESRFPLWLTGLGIPSDDIALQAAVEKSRLFRFYPADLGALGVLITFGSYGLITFFATSLSLMFYLSKADRTYLGSLSLISAATALYGVIAPTIALDTGMILVSFMIYVIHYRRSPNPDDLE